MQIKQATMNNLDQILEILRDGRDQLASQGIDQWQGDYPNVEHVKEDINHGWAYLAQADDDETVGVLSIVEAPDHSYDELDGDWLIDTDKYVVIHRVAIHSNHTGKGYASALFTSVINYIKTHRPEIKSIRIDTHEDNKAMQHLITKNGFTKVGELHGVYRPDENSYVYALLTHPESKK